MTVSELARYDWLYNYKEYCNKCTVCSLHKEANKKVYGKGPISPDFMIIGEAPGYYEDLTGKPFVGKAGDLLEKLIKEVWGISRDEIYITNTVKCRPPNNRNPEKDEYLDCVSRHLLNEILIVQPKVILTLGKFATMLIAMNNSRIYTNTALFNNNLKISQERGKPFKIFIRSVPSDYKFNAIASWHPAYVLRNPNAEQDLKNDMMLAQAMVKDSQ